MSDGGPAKRAPRGGATWMTYSYFVGFGLQGLYFLILARGLGADQFGVFSGALALATILSTFAGLGGGHLMVIAVSRDRAMFGRHFGVFLVYLATTFLPLALVGGLLALVVDVRFFWAVLPLLVSELVFMRIIDFVFQSFQAHDRLAVTANLNVMVAALRLLTITLASALGKPGAVVWALVYAGINIVVGLVLLVVVWRRMGSPSFHRETAARGWRTGIYFALGMSSRVVYTDGDKYLLNAFNQADIAGQYSAASRLVNFAFAPVQAIVYSSNTTLFRAGVSGFRAVSPIVTRILRKGVLLSMLASVALFAAAPLVPLILGADFADTADLLRLICGVPLLMAIHLTFGDALMGVGRQRVRALGQASMAVLAVVANLVLIPLLGVGGVIISLYVVHLGLTLINSGAFYLGMRSERSM